MTSTSEGSKRYKFLPEIVGTDSLLTWCLVATAIFEVCTSLAVASPEKPISGNAFSIVPKRFHALNILFAGISKSGCFCDIETIAAKITHGHHIARSWSSRVSETAIYPELPKEKLIYYAVRSVNKQSLYWKEFDSYFKSSCFSPYVNLPTFLCFRKMRKVISFLDVSTIQSERSYITYVFLLIIFVLILENCYFSWILLSPGMSRSLLWPIIE